MSVPAPITVRVSVAASYDVVVGRGVLASVGERVRAVVPQANRVMVVYDEGLLPKSLLPKEVLGLMDRRELERKALEAESVKCAAFNDRNRVRDELQRLERDLRMLPISRDRQQQEARLNAEIERAKAALAAAEARLSDAERAHAKARAAL